MGCCKSFPDVGNIPLQRQNSIRANLPLTQAEMAQLEIFLSDIPDHCQQPIINLPPRQLLNSYQYHKMALYYGSQKEWSLAISYEHRVIKGFQALLPTNKDHYIFFKFYSTLSAFFLAVGELQSAIEGIHIALAILLKHTPTDYKTLSNHYYYLSNAYKASEDWKATAQYLIIAIEVARLRDDLDPKFIPMLKIELQMAKQQLGKDMSLNLKVFEIKRKVGENDYDFHRRKTAANITFNTQHATLYFDKNKFEHLPDKQTELEVTDEILKDVLTHLEKHVTLNAAFIPVEFIAAQFKNVQMETSPLSVTIIEAALKMIFDRLNDENMDNDELYVALKQAPVSFSYKYGSHLDTRGVRVFKMRKKVRQSDC